MEQQPARTTVLPYSRQTIDNDDIAAVVEALESGWLTTGPRVQAFEEAIPGTCRATWAAAFNSGTAALHAAIHALAIGTDDEVIVPAITFAATANAAVYEGATPVFADVDPDTLLIDISDVERKITPATKAVVAVDYAGQPCDYDSLRSLCKSRGIKLIADACHSFGATYQDGPVGTLADITAFSFHPVKGVTTGEGGAITTSDEDLLKRAKRFRNHGIETDHRQRETAGRHDYEMVELGWNYRLSDIQCALGISQLGKLPEFLSRRKELAAAYQVAFSSIPGASPLNVLADRKSAWHLYVVKVNPEVTNRTRDELFTQMRDAKIGVNVHYVPVHLHPFYQQTFGTSPGLCPIAEEAYNHILSLPIFPSMTAQDQDDVTGTLNRILTD